MNRTARSKLAKANRYKLVVEIQAIAGELPGMVGTFGLAWEGYVSESCTGKNADCRTYRRELLEAVIQTAQEQLDREAEAEA